MVIVIDEEKVLRIAKRIALSIVAFAVLLFLILSGMVFKFSRDHSLQYELKYSMMNPSGKAVATSMRKTGEVEDTILYNRKAFRGGEGGVKNNAFFDAVSQNHKNER